MHLLCYVFQIDYPSDMILGGMTVVICNYSSPDNVEKIIKELSKNPNIDEIIVTHGKPETYRDFEGAKNIKNYEINSKYGSAQRYFAALESSNTRIMFLDDDHIPNETLIWKMLKLSYADPDQIYGPYKRMCLKTGYIRGKVTKDNYNVILIGLAMTSKDVVESYLIDFEKYSDFLEESGGNGEDLSFNRSFIDNYGKKPYYIESDEYLLLKQTDAYQDKPDHYPVRDCFCNFFF